MQELTFSVAIAHCMHFLSTYIYTSDNLYASFLLEYDVELLYVFVVFVKVINVHCNCLVVELVSHDHTHRMGCGHVRLCCDKCTWPHPQNGVWSCETMLQ